MLNQFIDIYLDMKILRNGFIFCFLGVILLTCADVISLSFKAHSFAKNTVLDPRLKHSGMTRDKSSLEPLSSYEEAFQKSALFGLYTEAANLPVFKSSIQELTKDLRLKGIVVLDQAEAIIEDARTQKNTFLKTGDSIGELTVKEIKDGAIVLSYYGEEKELKIQ